MQFLKVPGLNGAAESPQWDVKYWLFHQGAAESPLDVLLDVWVDTSAIIFSVFLSARTWLLWL